MRNRYEVRGDHVAIELCDRVTRRTEEALVDLADLPLVASIKNSWGIVHSGGRDRPMIARARHPGPFATVSMHRLITGAGPRIWVTHRNGNGLDNRRKNLIIGRPVEVVGYSKLRRCSAFGPSRTWTSFVSTPRSG